MQHRNTPPTEILPPEHYDEVHGNTLGLRAVRMEEERVHSELTHAELLLARERAGQALGEAGVALSVERQEELQDQYDELDIKVRETELFEKKEAKAVRTQLNAVRAKLRGLSGREREEFDKYMDQDNSFGFFHIEKELAETDDANHDWADWLADNTTNEQLIKFLQWHVDVINEQQLSPESNDLIEVARDVFRQEVERGIKEKWLSKVAQTAIDKVAEIKVLIADGFDTYFQGDGGYFWPGTSELSIEQGSGHNTISRLNSLLLSFENALIHEFSHAVIEDGEHDENVHAIGATWISEALTEHIHCVMKGGDPNSIRGIEGTRRMYLAQRLLLADYLELGMKKVNPKLAMPAYSGDAKDQAIFYRQLDMAWGPGSLVAINKRITKYTARFLKIINDIPEYKQLSDNERLVRAQKQAVEATHAELKEQPHKIFGGKSIRMRKTKEPIAA